MQVPSWPSDTQCSAAFGSRAAASAEFRKRLFLDRDDRHLVALGAGGIEHEKRKPAVAGDQTELHRDASFVRMTSRLLVRNHLFGPARRTAKDHAALAPRMKSTR